MRYGATTSDKDLYTQAIAPAGAVAGGPAAADERSREARKRLVAGTMDIFRGFMGQHAAFLFACLFLVMEYNKLQHVYPIIDVIPWGTVTLLMPFMFAFIDRQSRMPPSVAVGTVAAFSFCVALSVVFAFSPAASIEEWQRIVSPMVMILLLTSIIRTRQRIFLYTVTYFAVNMKMAQHGFLTWAARGFGFAGWGATGSPVWFRNSGEFAMEMTIFLALVLAIIAAFRKEWSWPVRWLFYTMAIMAAGSVVASSSRGGILGMAAVGLWLLMYSRQRFRVLALVGVLAAVVFYMTPPQFKERFATAGEDGTSVARLTYWNYALETLGEHPVVGIGYKNWRAYSYVHYPELAGIGGSLGIEVVHNTFLEAASELGGLGFIVYAAILVLIFRTNHRSWRIAQERGDKFLAAVAQGTMGGLIAYLVTSFFMSVLFYPVIWMLLVFTICVATVLRESAPRPQVPQRRDAYSV